MSLEWYISYLSNSKLCVEFNGIVSSLFKVDYDSPQGSVLSPVLYNYFTNDLRKQLRYCQCICFADNTTIFVRGTNLKFMSQKIKAYLSAITTHFKQHCLTLNIDKTNLMVFSKALDLKIAIEFNRHIIKQVHSTKFLGIIIDDRLKWDLHVNHVCSKISSGIFSMKCLSNLGTSNVLRYVYLANVQSHILYSVVTWYPMISTKLRKCIILLNDRALKISGKNKHIPVTETLTKFKLLPLDVMSRLELSKLSFRYTESIVLKRLCNLFNMKHHNYNTRSENSPITPVHGSKLYNSSFLRQAPNTWRTIPPDIKNVKSLKSFVKR